MWGIQSWIAISESHSIGYLVAESVSRLQICSTKDSVIRRGAAREADFQSAFFLLIVLAG